MVGNRRKYKTVEEMDKVIENYFKECDDNDEPYTITGLAIRLGFYGRQELLNYLDYVDENEKTYSDSIKRAKARCEEKLIKNMLTNKYNPTAGIFVLKNNYGYKDKQEVENSGTQSMVISIQGDASDWAK
jgi:hypothetical protein